MKQLVRHEMRVLFRALVCEVNDVLTSRSVHEDTMWEMARRLHSTWHRIMALLEDEEKQELLDTERRHPALSELLRLIDLEVEP
jgi:hypothetical protein